MKQTFLVILGLCIFASLGLYMKKPQPAPATPVEPAPESEKEKGQKRAS